MPTSHAAVRLGDADLARDQHVCALFNGPREAARALDPFVLDALERGDRVIHVVGDARAYAKGIRRFAPARAALKSGQLDVRTWSESYLDGGRFSARRMLAYVRRAVREGPGLGYSATRLIGDMEWAADGVPGGGELLSYEGSLDPFLARPRVTVLCAYDVQRHPGSRIAAVLGAHRVAVVGGQRQSIAPSVVAPRERILEAAALLFAENGAAATGVDTLIEASRVAKATFYRHFPSKDHLIVAWLENPRARWFDRIRTRVEARARSATQIVPLLFDAVAEWLEDEDFVGCPYLYVGAELSGSNHPASAVIRRYLDEIRSYLGEQAAMAGHPAPERAGRQLQALLAGSISLAVATRTTDVVREAREAAIQLMNQDQRA